MPAAAGRGGKDHFATRTLTLARFNLKWLTRGKDRLEKRE